MGKRGPKPKPREQKRAEGTHRQDREAANAPKSPEARIPEPPDELGAPPWGDEAVRLWFDLAPLLKKRGLMAKDYALDFFALCDGWAKYLYYREEIAEKGVEVMSAKGTLMYRPAYAAMNRAWEEFTKMTSRFGLNPSELASVSSLDTAEKGDPAEGFFEETG